MVFFDQLLLFSAVLVSILIIQFFVAGAEFLFQVSTPSDMKLKSNVRLVSNSLEIIDSIRGVYFEWNEVCLFFFFFGFFCLFFLFFFDLFIYHLSYFHLSSLVRPFLFSFRCLSFVFQLASSYGQVPGKKEVGVIAQDVASVLPDAVGHLRGPSGEV